MRRIFIKIGLLQLIFAGSLIYVQAQQDTANTSDIQEVVVTAYGVKKEKRSLGYVYQDIKGSDVVEAREVNVTDAMVGKISGLQLVKSAAGPAGSSKIILRGFNSLTNDNQPLIVVDGIPMSNFQGSSNNDFWNAEADMGNGLSDLNPEDIENITVLKGGAASALYGSRAGNGVVMITTKTGRRSRGAGITYSNTLNIQTAFMLPKMQRVFSQGIAGQYVKEGVESWGTEITGQTVENWEGKNEILRSYDNYNSFFHPSVAENNTVTFQQSIGEKSTIFSSASYLFDSGVVPNTKYQRLNAMTRVTSTFGENDKWHSDIKIQYINSYAANRPVGGHDSGYYGTVIGLPTTVDLGALKEGMDELGAKQRWYTPNSNNPWWSVYNNLNSDVRNRFLMNGNIRYDFADWVNFDVKVGSDMYNTKTEQKTYSGGYFDNRYVTGMNKFMENNYIASLNFHQDNLFGKWSGAFSLYGQIMTSRYNSLNINAVLDVPDYFSVGNAINNQPSVSEGRTRTQINSAFATLDINYDNFWFINATARNDWSSTMSEANRSYFYPSVSSSLVLTDMFNKLWNTRPFGNVLTFVKLRGSYAVTGNSLGPYSLYNVYGISHDPLGNLTASGGTVLFNPNLVSELLKTYEFGANVRFFNRVDLDVNFYNTHATNQLIEIPLNPLSGYTGEMVNAGDIQNKGIEVTVDADIIRKPNFGWNMNVNFSKNKNTINELKEGVEQKSLGGFDSVAIMAYVGHRYGTIMGTAYQRVEDKNSPYFGRKILTDAGLPTTDKNQYVLGDQTPRALLGVTNRFRFGNLGLSFQIDGRFGGQFFSGTKYTMQYNGLAPETVVNGGRENFVVDGVIPDGSGGYTENTIAVSPEDYWHSMAQGGNLGINEENVYDATNIRLRNVQLTYTFPKSLFENSAFQSAKVSFSVNNAWMIYSKVKDIDPEASYALSSNAQGFEYLAFPSVRSFVFNLTVGF